MKLAKETAAKEPEIWVGTYGGVRIVDEKAFSEHPEVKARMKRMREMDIVGKTLGGKVDKGTAKQRK